VCGECIDHAPARPSTENSYKYSLESFGALARAERAGRHAVWTDADKYFSVHALRLQDGRPTGATAVRLASRRFETRSARP
jgi:hypothetical protein